MNKIIAVLNFKGGVGKTTTAVNLADALHRQHKNVLLVDIDSQRNATIILDRDKDVDATVFSAMEDVARHRPDAGLDIYEHNKNFDFVAGDIRLKDIEVVLAGVMAKEMILRRLLEIPSYDYDYIIIDCPPNAGIMTVNAMVAANSLLIPVDSQPMALDGLADITSLYSEVRSTFNPQLTILGYLITRYRQQYSSSKAVLRFLQDRQKDFLLNTRIRENTTLGQAPGKRQTIYEYDPECAGAQDYTQLAKEIIKITRQK
jgi:chromosome partitioning protein